MNKLKNFQLYIPGEGQLVLLALFFFKVSEVEHLPENWHSIINNSGIQFLKSEDGLDWYISQKDFSDDKIKLSYDACGVIRSVSNDISSLWPLGQSVVEINREALPEGFSADGAWAFVDDLIIRVFVDEPFMASQKKIELLSTSAISIAPLQDSIDLNIATEAETEKLTTWKKYRVELNRIDTSLAPDIDWPIPPA